ncbi:MAG: glycosyltransferase family 2 protein [Thermoplasmata archaeon]
MLDLTVVIRCGDDERVFRCIESIDETVEIIVSASENPVLQAKLEERGIEYCLTPRFNLSVTSNMGFEKATHDKVLITDSDTWFESNCIKRVYDALEDFKVARTRLVFDHGADVPFSRLVSEARDYVNSLPVVYTPGIGIRADLVPDIGGFLFNDPVPYAVDADLNYRIQKAGIPVKFLSDAIIHHDVVGVWQDLKAATRIGLGCMVSAQLLSGHHISGASACSTVRELKGVKPRHLMDVAKSKGIGVFLYQLLWDLHFYTGRNFQWLFRRYKHKSEKRVDNEAKVLQPSGGIGKHG